jgi:ribosomal protein L35
MFTNNTYGHGTGKVKKKKSFDSHQNHRRNVKDKIQYKQWQFG